jgi:hypothetical protein
MRGRQLQTAVHEAIMPARFEGSGCGSGFSRLSLVEEKRSIIQISTPT